MSDPNSLYQWCMNTINDNTECDKLEIKNNSKDLDLTQLLSKELAGKDKEEIQREINEKRRLILNLKRYKKDRDTLTEEIRLQEHKIMEKDTYWNMIFMGIVLVISFGLAIMLIIIFFRK